MSSGVVRVVSATVRRLGAVIAGCMLMVCAPAARAEDIHVVLSGGLVAAFKELAPVFEQRTHHRVIPAFGPSMGTFPASIPMRLDRAEPVDVVIMVSAAIKPLVAKGQVAAGSEVPLARSKIAMVVRKGAPAPDISTVEALKRVLLAARNVALSDSASGVYFSTELYMRLGIEKEMAGKSRMLPGSPVGESVARGEYEIGFQQNSELLPVPGVQVVGTIPDAVQLDTVYSAALATHAGAPAGGRALMAFLASPDAAAAIRASGLEPIATGPARPANTR